jgi:hypothetical protein
LDAEQTPDPHGHDTEVDDHGSGFEFARLLEWLCEDKRGEQTGAERVWRRLGSRRRGCPDRARPSSPPRSSQNAATSAISTPRPSPTRRWSHDRRRDPATTASPLMTCAVSSRRTQRCTQRSTGIDSIHTPGCALRRSGVAHRVVRGFDHEGLNAHLEVVWPDVPLGCHASSPETPADPPGRETRAVRS